VPRRHEPIDWYDAPLYYDIAFQSITGDEVPFLDALYREMAPTRRKRMLEPACGSGRLVAALAKRGYAVTGFDLNDAMLAFAEQRLRRTRTTARLSRGDMRRFSLRGRFDFAHCLVNSFKYMTSEAAAREHLQAVAQHLVPGGIYVLGFHLSEYDDDQISRERWVGERRGVHVVCNIQSWPPDRRRRLERVRSRLVVNGRGPERRYETSWQFRTYDARQFRALVRAVPDFEHVATFDFDYDLNAPGELGGDRLDVIAVLRKRRTG